MRPKIIATATAMGAIATISGVGSSQAIGSAHSHPQASSGWVRTITNPYLPYTPGSKWVYKGIKDGVSQTDVVIVTRRTRLIDGVRATTITDVATHGSHLLESTTDWYAQDSRGDVWYFGEATTAYLANGKVDTSGSWLAGVHGAKPGIVMTNHPAVGDAYRQEYWRGHAEDQYWLVDLSQTVKVPFVTSHHAALTLEWSRLEPGVIDQKYYVPGVGVVRELAAKGPTEYASLIHYSH